MHDPTSVDHQSSFIENWWLLTGSRLCDEIKKTKCKLSYVLVDINRKIKGVLSSMPVYQQSSFIENC